MSIFLESVRNFKQPTEQMSVWSFARVVVLYLLITVTLFVFASAGWSGFFIFFSWGLLSFVLAIITLLVAAYLSSVYEKPVVVFDKRFFLFILAVQFITVLFNFNDNGDNGGQYTFIERLLNTSGFQTGDGILNVFSLPLHVFYFFLLVGFILVTLNGARKFVAAKTLKTEKHPRKGSGSVLGAMIGGMLGALSMPVLYFYQFQVFNDYQWQLFRTPVISFPAIILFGCIGGILIGRLFTLPLFLSRKAPFLLLLLWPVMFWLSVLGIEHKMNIDLAKVVYPGAVMIYKDIQVFKDEDFYSMLLQNNVPVSTAYYEMEGQNPELLDFFDRAFASQARRKYDSKDQPAFFLSRSDVYVLQHRIVTVDKILDPSYLEEEILQKIKPGKEYYKLKIEYRDASLDF